MPDVRFEVEVNGHTLCVAGVDQRGVLSQTLTYAPMRGPLIGGEGPEDSTNPDRPSAIELNIGGLQDDSPLLWLNQPLRVGDVVTLRVLGVGDCDPPTRRVSTSEIDDAVFGRIKFNGIDAWDGRVVDERFGRELAVHVWAEELGPNGSQRELFKRLRVKFPGLIRQIVDAIAVQFGHETAGQLSSMIGVHIGDVSTQPRELELVFSREDAGASGAAYFVIIRNWQIAKIVEAK
jgi:hypothetical protein